MLIIPLGTNKQPHTHRPTTLSADTELAVFETIVFRFLTFETNRLYDSKHTHTPA